MSRSCFSDHVFLAIHQQQYSVSHNGRRTKLTSKHSSRVGFPNQLRSSNKPIQLGCENPERRIRRWTKAEGGPVQSRTWQIWLAANSELSSLLVARSAQLIYLPSFHFQDQACNQWNAQFWKTFLSQFWKSAQISFWQSAQVLCVDVMVLRALRVICKIHCNFSNRLRGGGGISTKMHL